MSFLVAFSVNTVAVYEAHIWAQPRPDAYHQLVPKKSNKHGTYDERKNKKNNWIQAKIFPRHSEDILVYFQYQLRCKNKENCKHKKMVPN